MNAVRTVARTNAKTIRSFLMLSSVFCSDALCENNKEGMCSIVDCLVDTDGSPAR
jgi:hypothetical protein